MPLAKLVKRYLSLFIIIHKKASQPLQKTRHLLDLTTNPCDQTSATTTTQDPTNRNKQRSSTAS